MIFGSIMVQTQKWINSQLKFWNLMWLNIIDIITVDCLDGNYDACQLKIKSAKDEDEEEEECVFVVRRFVERNCLIEKLDKGAVMQF